MTEKMWIEQAEENHMFSGGEKTGDADRLLELNRTNRIVSAEQTVLLTINRALARINHDSAFLNDLCLEVEQSQLVCDGQSRDQFMKVAIEQYQAKLANAKRSLAEKLL